MPYIVQYNAQNHILEGVFTGVVNRELLKQYSIDSKKVYLEHHCKLSLSDYRKAIFDLSIIDLYRLPQKHNDLLNSFGMNIFKLKRAAVFNQEGAEMAKFFEDVAVNRGQQFKAFTDKDAAMEWLLSK
jgi:hypothetical protein